MKDAFDIVIFGGAGDLALRKLVPALYRAFREGSFNPESRIMASCHSQEQADHYIENAREALSKNLSPDEYCQESWDTFKQALKPQCLDITQCDEQWHILTEQLNQQQERVRVFYLAIPPMIYGVCCEHLSALALITEYSRLVVEKPIGYDRESADHINTKIARFFPEESIYRIDHYLGKETVQNLLALRFSNLIFEQLWDAKSIDNVQISISETVGLEGRAGFYDGAGALRDMVQNHLLQLLCLVAMESPAKFNERSIRAEKIKVLESLRPLQGDDVHTKSVRGQYVAGNINEELVSGYLEELQEPHSQTETFVALCAHIDNWRWSNVPFYLRTGKRMKARSAEIVIQFKQVSHRLYDESAGAMLPNRLIIQLQPEESIQLTMMTKHLQKLDMELEPVTLNLNFSDNYDSFRSDAYKRLMLDAAAGDPSLFIHREEVGYAWDWIDPIIAAWKTSSKQPQLYRAGSWGPAAADDLLAANGHCWFNVADNGRGKVS